MLLFYASPRDQSIFEARTHASRTKVAFLVQE